MNKALYSPLAGLLQIASLMPEEKYDVILTDENIEDIDFDLKCDLVCISAMTSYVIRGYEIADIFRSKNIPVIMGGVHPSFMPYETLEHADAVCIGEAEMVMDKILLDLDNGCMKGIYKSDQLCDMSELKPPRMDIVKKHRYINSTFIQTARGCPTACSFCAEHLMYGMKYRFRPIEDVVEEIKNCGSKNIALNDVDVFSTRKRTKELLNAIKPLNIKWQGAVSCRHAENEELLQLAADSGCFMLSIGFESISQKSLKGVHKNTNKPEEYAKLIEKIHSYGIMVFGLFMFGFDDDTEETFDETLKFAMDTKLDMCGFSLVTPYPGTLLFYEMQKEKRITSYNWDKYDQGFIVYETRGLTADVLWDKQLELYKKFYSFKSMAQRFPYFDKRSKGYWAISNLFFRKGEVIGSDVSDPIIVDDTRLNYLPQVPLIPKKKEWQEMIAISSAEDFLSSRKDKDKTPVA